MIMTEKYLNGQKRKKYKIKGKEALVLMAGVERLELPNDGIRIRCLTNLAIPLEETDGWDGWTRTIEWRDQNPLPWPLGYTPSSKAATNC